jgi:hypothetical protein
MTQKSKWTSWIKQHAVKVQGDMYKILEDLRTTAAAPRDAAAAMPAGAERSDEDEGVWVWRWVK